MSFGIRTFSASQEILSSFEEPFPRVWRVYRINPTGTGAEIGYLDIPPDNYYYSTVLPDVRAARNAPNLSRAADGRLQWRYAATTWGTKVGAYVIVIVK